MNTTAKRLLALFLPLAAIAAACGSDEALEAATATTTAVTDGEMADGETADGEMADGEAMDDTDHGDDEGHDDHDDHGDDEGHDDHDGTMDGDAMDDMDHAHSEAIDAAAWAPAVAIEVLPDPAGGVNVAVTSTNHEVSAAAASSDPVNGQGHYHLYVDGVKRSRFYNDWIYVAGVDAGEHEFVVTLNANNHSDLEVEGQRIEAVSTLEVPEHEHDDHGHDEAEPQDAAGVTISDLRVTEDAKSGWNLNVAWDGFTMAPEHASGDHVDGEGHLHVMVNGEKLERIYGGDLHIAALPEGDVIISVAAFTNDHRPYTVAGNPAQAATSITVESA